MKAAEQQQQQQLKREREREREREYCCQLKTAITIVVLVHLMFHKSETSVGLILTYTVVIVYLLSLLYVLNV